MGTVIDAVLVVAVALAAYSGYRQGALVSASSLVGLALGAVAGILIAPRAISAIDDARMRVIVGIAILVVLVVVGEVAGMVLGRSLRGWLHNSPARFLDSLVGMVLQALAVLVGAWLLATPLRDASLTGAATADAVGQSRVLTKVGEVAPPWLAAVPDRFRTLLNESGLPDAIGPYGRTTINPVDPPDPALVRASGVAQVRDAVVKVRGEAPACQRALEGSGFVFAPDRVMTNAHVVAGTSSLTVRVGSRVLPATVVLFDPDVDVAVLEVPGLGVAPLRFVDSALRTGDDAIALGYPQDGPFRASPMRVRGKVNLSSPDIYGQTQTRREAYTLRGRIEQGNSGGPLITPGGEVAGMVFGAGESAKDETGFAITAAQLSDAVAKGRGSDSPVSTEGCVLG